MNFLPDVSVVMSVYNGGEYLNNTIESVLSQRGVEFEFIIINDGSTDSTLDLLSKSAKKDNRIRVLTQKNLGLTSSLIRGCKVARANYIARQDCGDLSLSNRLSKQAAILEKNPEVVLVSTDARFLGPLGEYLYTISQNSKAVALSPQTTDLKFLRGPSHHGCTMFRRNIYKMVGGYRHQFRVAQDLDLWTRMVEHGKHHSLQEVLYEAVLTPSSISSTMKNRQTETSKIIAKCIQRRRIQKSESDLLDLALSISVKPQKYKSSNSEANFYYFIASCLKKHNTVLAKKYYLCALKKNIFHFKSLVRYGQLLFNRP